ncbi:MAG: AgmX/PglI C-terminal domain-containing protein [Polyangiales bacterium]
MQAEHLLSEPRPVVLGYGPDALFPLPEAEATRGDITLLTPTTHGVTLHLPAEAGGAVWLLGERYDVRALRARAPDVQLGSGDYGVLSFGAASYFFQQVRTPEPARRTLGSLDWEAALSLGLSVFLHGLVLGFMLLASRAFPFEPTLDVRPELRARVAAVEARAPYEAPRTPAETSTPDAPEPAPRKPHPQRAPRTSRATSPASAAAGAEAAAAEKVRGMGLLGAIAGSDGLKGALQGDSVGALLGGLGAAKASAGVSGGRALRGAGGGEQGTLLGGGPIGTGTGGGRVGAGTGAGGKGAGKGAGGKGELRVAVTPGAPQVSGFLSAEQINRVVRANQAALRYCYETEVQRQRGLRGKVVLQWRVDRAGGVPDARVAQSTLKNANVEGCMLRQVRKWRFPKPDGGEVAVVYPFLFGTTD